MTRAYTFRKRKPVSLDVAITPPSEESVRILELELYEQRMRDGSAAYLALSGLRSFDLIDVLKDELQECPESPVSKEIKRLVRETCREDAWQIVRSILKEE